MELAKRTDSPDDYLGSFRPIYARLQNSVVADMTTRRSFILGALSTALWVPTRSFHDIGRSYSIAEELAAVPNQIRLKDVETRMLVDGVWVEIETQPEPVEWYSEAELAEARELPSLLEQDLRRNADEYRMAGISPEYWVKEMLKAAKRLGVDPNLEAKLPGGRWHMSSGSPTGVLRELGYVKLEPPLTLDDIRKGEAWARANKLPPDENGNYWLHPSGEITGSRNDA